MLYTFEGIDGAGKTTVMKGVYHKLRSSMYQIQKDFFMTSEPRGTTFGELIAVGAEENKVSKECSQLIMAACHMHHWDKFLEPLLNAGASILCDRYLDSFEAYQGMKITYAFLDWDFQKHLDVITKTFYLRVSPDTAIQRIYQRAPKGAVIKEDWHHLNKVGERYDAIVNDPMNKGRFVTLNAEVMDVVELVNAIYDYIVSDL